MSAIDTLRLQIKYPRPQELSDPHWDFTADYLEKILATNDQDFDGVGYRILFGPYLPAGTYQELMYFLPLAFAYFAQPENEGDGHEMLLSLVGFASDHVENLKTDGLLEIVGDCFQECFQSWTTSFSVLHLDKSTGHNWRYREYRDIVERLSLLSETIYQMRIYSSLADIPGVFAQQLAQNESDPIKAAWFLAYAADEYLRDEQTPDMFKFKFDA